MPLLEDLITQLQADGVGTFNQNLFASSKAAVPVLASGLATLTITETGGTGAENTHNSTIKPAYLQPGAQLRARADGYLAASNMAIAAYNSLVKIRNTFINSGWYKWIKPLQEPFDAGLDARGQIQYDFNVIVNKRP